MGRNKLGSIITDYNQMLRGQLRSSAVRRPEDPQRPGSDQDSQLSF